DCLHNVFRPNPRPRAVAMVAVQPLAAGIVLEHHHLIAELAFPYARKWIAECATGWQRDAQESRTIVAKAKPLDSEDPARLPHRQDRVAINHAPERHRLRMQVAPCLLIAALIIFA